MSPITVTTSMSPITVTTNMSPTMVLVLVSFYVAVQAAPSQARLLFPVSQSELCAEHSLHYGSSSYLVRDTENCRKFYSCHRKYNGAYRAGGDSSKWMWLAYHMDCPGGTVFDGEMCHAGNGCGGRWRWRMVKTGSTSTPGQQSYLTTKEQAPTPAMLTTPSTESTTGMVDHSTEATENEDADDIDQVSVSTQDTAREISIENIVESTKLAIEATKFLVETEQLTVESITSLVTTESPVNTTAYLSDTTQFPVDTKSLQVETSSFPVGTTKSPVETIDFPVQTVGLVQTTSFPVESTDFPIETTKFLVETTDIPVQTTSFPTESTDFSIETTNFLVETTDFPGETTHFRVETSGFPVKTTSFPVETADFPIENTDFQVETTDFQVETTDFLVETTNIQIGVKTAEFPVETTAFPINATPFTVDTTAMQANQLGTTAKGTEFLVDSKPVPVERTDSDFKFEKYIKFLSESISDICYSDKVDEDKMKKNIMLSVETKVLSRQIQDSEEVEEKIAEMYKSTFKEKNELETNFEKYIKFLS